MKIVTWNVNSLRIRLARVLALLERHQPDVLCLQETKVGDDDFPTAEIEALGYRGGDLRPEDLQRGGDRVAQAGDRRAPRLSRRSGARTRRG